MTRSQAYKVLGLQPGATEVEIRKRFKKLAFKVHPDVNSSKNANEQFILITQAMELLMSSDVPHYQHEINERQYHRKARQEETPEEREIRMHDAKMRFERQKQHTFSENKQYLQQLLTGRRWFIFKWITGIAAALIAVLILDLFLPFHYKKDELVGFSTMDYSGILHNKITAVELKDNGIYFAKMDRGTWLANYPDIVLKESWFLHTPISFYSSDDFTESETKFDFHIGSVKYILILVLLFPLFTVIRKRKDLTFVFLYQVSFWGIGLLEILILFTKDRLLHILSLGFL